jgi:hypothetical protein
MPRTKAPIGEMRMRHFLNIGLGLAIGIAIIGLVWLLL